ncbi:hypothetical protein CLV72_108119 [Allonocardiopsis opalescens]|uniref:Transcription factor zinc-finger domain-containing protein n=2 Tax=Allonocardiopsis opalescens TaxID=1144618 RepID=A0A2T0PX42_9ACTN|nr:hypothetical protein CLV72_108119 [Allonocardiopsis opalescens]
MRTINRQGLRIEQCEGCRGIFLDRGELEQIISAEQRHYGGGMPHGGGYGDSPPPYRGRPDSPSPYHGGHGGYSDSPPPYGGQRRRRKSFLEDLFD